MNKETLYLLASIVESSQDSIVSIDLDRNITSWNKGAEDLYGYPAEEAIGKPLEMVMLPEDIRALIEKVNSIVHEITIPMYETIRIHKNGKQADLEILLSPVRSANGEVMGVSTVARDITIRKMHEQQKDDFINVASHELKTPLTSIKACAEILEQRLAQSTDTANSHLIKILLNQVNRLVDLTGVLLDTTKLGAGEIPLDISDFDFNELIGEQVEACTLLPGGQPIRFEPAVLKSISADRKLIGQVATNIISNAIKYSPQGGDVIIRTAATDFGVELSVQDFGVGIPVGMKEKIFDRYFRVSDSSTAYTSGVGLGLYISKGIIQQHGGSISVQSEEGVGSTFFVRLPYEVDSSYEHRSQVVND